MSKNNIIGLVIIIGLLIGYSLWMTPSKEEMAAAKRKADSISYVQHADSMQAAMADMVKKAIADSIARANPAAAAGIMPSDTAAKGFASAAKSDEKFYTLESDLMKLKISSRESHQKARLAKWELFQNQGVDFLQKLILR